MTSAAPGEDPWDWLAPHDAERFGPVIHDTEERARWCRAILIGGLPYLWQHKAASLRDLVYSKLGLNPGDKVFILGESIATCGFEDDIRALVGPGGEVRSVDIIERARTSTFMGQRGRGGRIGTWQYDYAAGIPDGYFDCVAVLQAVQHCDDWREAGKDMLRIMKPGRTIMLAEIGFSPQLREAAKLDLHLEYWMDKLYAGSGMLGPEALSYYGSDALLAAFDGLVRNPSVLAWKGAELFWGSKA